MDTESSTALTEILDVNSTDFGMRAMYNGCILKK